ncbi:MAG: hypothetical protein U9O18_05015, partial [Chloroflexota bacterium]|nr:hypothetical protein [Chloroflexota bacterium]
EPTPEPTPTPSPEPTPTPTPTPSPTPEPTPEPTPTPTPTPSPTLEPTLEPTPEPTLEPTPEPTASATPEISIDAEAEAGLLARTSALICEAQPGTALALEAGARAGIACTPLDAAAEQLTLQYFAEPGALPDYWLAELEALALPLEETEDACENAEPGVRKWGFGSIACLLDGDTAQIRWTDRRTQTFGVIEGTNGDISELYQWWRATARPLGRSVDAETDGPDGPTPSKAPPLVRVPGPPRAITCDAISEPIPDDWERTWRIKNIEFQIRGKTERVILNLERTGKNRKGKPTQAIIERMPVPQVADAVPGASRPKRGRTAIVVRLDGVRDAPDLRGYRPSTDLVKELSIVRDGGSRVVILSTALDTCYQMRIPIWGPSATGNEDRAKVYIDLKESPGN